MAVRADENSVEIRNLQSRILYLVKLSFVSEGEITLSENQKLREDLTLQAMSKELLQVEEK